MPDSPYIDDLVGIPPGSRLIRRISSQFVDWAQTDEHGRPRITSQAAQFYSADLATKFGCPGPALSVIIEAIAVPLTDLQARYPGDGLASLDADLVRGDPPVCGIQHWPREDEPAHAVVFRLDGGRDLPGGARKRLAAFMSDHWLVVASRP